MHIDSEIRELQSEDRNHNENVFTRANHASYLNDDDNIDDDFTSVNLHFNLNENDEIIESDSYHPDISDQHTQHKRNSGSRFNLHLSSEDQRPQENNLNYLPERSIAKQTSGQDFVPSSLSSLSSVSS